MKNILTCRTRMCGPVRALAFSAIAFFASTALAQLTFQPTVYNFLDDGCSALITGDFNNDGVIDAVSSNNNFIGFYKGLGNGKFAAPVRQSVRFGCGQVLAADFNKDGRIDLAIAQVAGLKAVVIMFGNGNGTFTRAADVATFGVPNYRIALADFNGDHLPDIAASSCSQVAPFPCSTEVFLGNGDGTFRKRWGMSIGGGPVVAGDFNADGHQDLAVIDRTANVHLVLGRGDGTFGSAVSVTGVHAYSLTVGDFMHNQVQSLAALYWVDKGSGDHDDFLYTLRYANNQLQLVHSQQIQSNTTAPYSDLTAGHLNGDMYDDLFLLGSGGVWGGTIAGYALSNGVGTFAAPVRVPEAGLGAGSPIIRDINGDSRHDLLYHWIDFMDSPPDGGIVVNINTNATTNCSLPRANQFAVHICAPYNNQAVGSSSTFKASANTWNGNIKRIELWIDGVKRAQVLSDQFKATLSLTRGIHKATFVAVDTFDQHVQGSAAFTASY